jgi:hypothetical protein
MESKRTKRTPEELEARGLLLEKDPLRYSILFQLEYLNRFNPTDRAN